MSLPPLWTYSIKVLTTGSGICGLWGKTTRAACLRRSAVTSRSLIMTAPTPSARKFSAAASANCPTLRASPGELRATDSPRMIATDASPPKTPVFLMSWRKNSVEVSLPLHAEMRMALIRPQPDDVPSVMVAALSMVMVFQAVENSGKNPARYHPPPLLK